MELGVSGKLVFISGSTLGIGLAIAKRYVELGASVIVNGRSEASVKKAVDELAQLGKGKVFGCAADIGSAVGANTAIEFIRSKGNLDILVNNLGIFEPKPFEQITDEEWLKFFEVNVLSGVRLCRAVLPDMLKRNSGSVVFIASEAGFCPKPFMVHYSMTKTAQISIARGLAEITKGTRVRVNTVLPGPTWTEGVADYIAKLAKEKNQTVEQTKTQYFKDVEPHSLLQRFVQPEEVANTVVFVSSDIASATNGSAVHADGGVVRHIV